MSDDEVFVLIFSLVIAAVSWAVWLLRLLNVRFKKLRGGAAGWLWAGPLAASLLVRNGPVSVPDDLAHVLLRWKEGGIELLGQDAQGAGPPQPLTVSPPKGFKALWYRLLAMAGLRRNSAGGFGSVIPQVASGAGIG